MVFDLSFGQRGLFNRRPHHGLGPLIQRAVHQEFHEFLGNHAFCVEIHRQVRFGPIAGDAQTLEFITLNVDPTFCEFPAFGAEIIDWDFVFVFALLAVLFFDLPFNRKPVTIPARDVSAVKAHHLMAAHDHVLDRFVQRVTDMQVAVRIGRAIMQAEHLAARLRTKPVINPDLFPMGQPFRFTLGQASAHREISFGEVQRVFVAGRISAHRGSPLGNGNQGSERRGLIRLCPAAQVLERRDPNSNDYGGATKHDAPYRQAPQDEQAQSQAIGA